MARSQHLAVAITMLPIYLTLVGLVLTLVTQ